jgi:hypothetical protein
MVYGEGSAARERNGKSPEENWGAKDSLKRNATGSLRKKGTNTSDDETTPFLGSGSGSDENGSVRELEWEGLVDFDGLPWWRTPSVSSFRCPPSFTSLTTRRLLG